MKTGSEALEKPKGEAKPEKKHEKKKSGLKLAAIHVKPLQDKTFHMEHHYEDANHLPHHHTPGYSAATIQDVQDHMAEHLPGGEGAGDPGAADPAAAAAPAAGQPTEPTPGE